MATGDRGRKFRQVGDRGRGRNCRGSPTGTGIVPPVNSPNRTCYPEYVLTSVDCIYMGHFYPCAIFTRGPFLPSGPFFPGPLSIYLKFGIHYLNYLYLLSIYLKKWYLVGSGAKTGRNLASCNMHKRNHCRDISFSYRFESVWLCWYFSKKAFLV